MLEMTRRHTHAKHPLQHVIFGTFLDACPPRTAPFGEGPWHCPNPIAGHQGEPTIRNVEEQRIRRIVTAMFRCDCGYAYTRSVHPDGRLGNPRFKEYGPLLGPYPTRLVKDGTTLRGAAATLNLHTRSELRRQRGWGWM